MDQLLAQLTVETVASITGYSFILDALSVANLFSIDMTIAATAGISDSEQGMASGLLNTSQQIGAALGLAILVAVSTARTEAVLASLGDAADAQRSALTAGFGAALTGSAGFAIAGVLVALWVIQEADCRKTKLGRVEVGRSR